MWEVFIFMAKPISYKIDVARNMTDINDLMCENTVAPSSMCSIEFITHYYISKCLTICLNFHGEAPYDVIKFVQRKL